MDIEQRETKGGFFKLFDWNAKSRKKLFSNKYELPAVLKQGSENVTENGIGPHLVGLHHNGTGLRDKASNDHNFALSVRCDDGYGTRVPGVVAKLMGLDSLPNSNGSESESSATPFCDSPFVSDSHCRRCDSNFQIEHHIKNEVPKFLEPSVQKMQNRTIERPQIKILPPKSAKSIPLPHHRLFPTKSSGFVPTDKVAYIVEADAKIIEQGPSATTPEGRMPCFRPSVSLRIPDLKEKTDTKHTVSGLPEASRVLKEPNPVIGRKVQDGGRRLTGNTQLSNNSMGSLKNSHESMKRKGSSASIATQAKANIQKKAGFISSSNRSSTSQKEGDLAKPGPNKSQTNTLKGVQKRASTNRTSDVLRKNNQKQNFVTNKDRATSRASVSNQEDRKIPSNNGCSLRPNKASNKVNSEMGSGDSVANDTGKELQSSKMKTFSKKKHSVHKDVPFEKILAKNVLINEQERSERYNIASGGCMNLGAVDRKSRMDVISFTFTSPIKRSMPGVLPSCLDIEKNNHLSSGSCHGYDTHDFKRLSSLGLSVIGGDALNVLLDQKLKELTCRVETSANKFVEAENTAYSSFTLQDSFPNLNVINTVSSEIENSCQLNWHEDQSRCPYDCSSVDNLWLKAKQKCQEFEEMEAHGSDSNTSETGKGLDFEYPSSVLSLEPSSSGGSCCSLDSKTSCITKCSKHSLLASTCQTVTCIHGRKCLPGAVEKELPDSASSQLAPFLGGNDMVSTTLGLMDFKRSSNSTWELECITKVLCSADFLFEDFILGRVNDLMTPNLFDQLENQKTGLDEDVEEYFKLQHEVLIDYVSEWLQLKWERQFGPSCKAWPKWATLIERKQCLAEELYREISSWRNMGDLMVDELVYKDMSSWYGRWVHFEIEAFEEGEEIQKMIVTSLIDEVVSDFLLMYSH